MSKISDTLTNRHKYKILIYEYKKINKNLKDIHSKEKILFQIFHAETSTLNCSCVISIIIKPISVFFIIYKIHNLVPWPTAFFTIGCDVFVIIFAFLYTYIQFVYQHAEVTQAPDDGKFLKNESIERHFQKFDSAVVVCSEWLE